MLEKWHSYPITYVKPYLLKIQLIAGNNYWQAICRIQILHFHGIDESIFDM